MNSIAIIAPAIDVEQIAREVAAVHIALQDVDRQVEAAEQRTESLRQEQARRRLQLGYLLIEARKAWPARGPKAKGWGEFLAKQGISQDSALRMMQLAGYVESVSRTDDSVREIPTVREVNAARAEQNAPRATKSESRVVTGEQQELHTPANDWQREVESRREPKVEAPTIDIDRELHRVHEKLFSFAEKVPPRERALIAHQLRETARLIEGMK